MLRMHGFLWLLPNILLSAVAAIAQDEVGDLTLIRQTLTDYIQGSTNGQPKRLSKAFHPQLNLYSIRNEKLRIWAGTDYINGTKEGQPTGEFGSILAIDFENDCAVAKVQITPQQGAPYVDYFMLLKIDGRWTIVHKMYTRRNTVAASSGQWWTKQAVQKQASVKQVNSNPKIDHIFAEYDRLDSPGAAICVMQGGSVIHRNAYGAANVEHGVPIDAANSVFNIGSCSKQFTAFAILLLVEDGKLSLDHDVRKYIPELPDLGRKITLRHMAYHTSGLRSELGVLAMAGWSPGGVIRRESILRMLYRQQGVNFEPGAEFSYCNSGYTLLAEVVERVSGQSFADFCRGRILNPIGMQNSAFAGDLPPLRPRMVYSYGRAGTEYYPRFPNDSYSGSTGLWTTCDDLARWVANFRDPKVGSPETMREMENMGILNSGKSTGYAMGLMVQSHRGRKHIHHSGATASYVAYTGRFPEEDLSIVLVANTNAMDAHAISLQVADTLLAAPAGGNQVDSVDESIALSNEQLDRFSGQYWNRKDTSVNISRQGGNLLYAIGGGPSLTLEPVGQTRVRMVGNSEKTHIEFEPSGDDKFEVSVVQARGEVARHFPDAPDPKSPAELQEYVGEYYSSELGTTYSVSVENEQLSVDHIRFHDNALTPIEGDAFRSNGWRFSTLVFERSQSKVTGFVINSTRNTGIRFRRSNQENHARPSAY
ncbi:MAG: serine hydrolase [Planctomycetota bacterium]